MKINITCEKPGWIMHRMAVELKKGLTNHEVFINEGRKDIDINYFINYGYYRRKSKCIDVGLFTHFDPNHLSNLWIKAANEMDYCIALSENTKNTLISQGIPEEKISVVILGADRMFVPKVRLGIVGRVYPGGRKGEHLVTELLEDSYITKIISLVAKHEGWGVPVNDLDYNDFYNSIDFLLIPSLQEGGPIPFMEALACGKLSIAPPIGNIPQFEHIEYKTGNIDDLKRAIIEACKPIYEERCKLASQVKKYNWGYWTSEHERILNKLPVKQFNYVTEM